MVRCMFLGSPGYNSDHDAFVFLVSCWRGIIYCAVARNAMVKIAKLFGEKSPLEIPYPNWLLERLLIEKQSVIERAALNKIADRDFTPNGAIFIREADISVS